MFNYLSLRRYGYALVALWVAAGSFVGQVTASESLPLSTGETLYLPIYSHIYHGELDPKSGPSSLLTSTHISIRNTDTKNVIRLTSARYYDTQGKLLREFIPSMTEIGPLGTHELFIPSNDKTGGSGANFIILWSAAQPTSTPIVEALHTDIRSSRSLMFVTTARQIK
jgi:hypothetical protein